jgi:hypothetical protein
MALFLTTMIAAAGTNWTVRDHVPLEKFVIRAHRGAGVLAAENTVAALEPGGKKLLELGFMSFATDHPDVIWDVVKKSYAQGKQ